MVHALGPSPHWRHGIPRGKLTHAHTSECLAAPNMSVNLTRICRRAAGKKASNDNNEMIVLIVLRITCSQSADKVDLDSRRRIECYFLAILVVWLNGDVRGCPCLFGGK